MNHGSNHLYPGESGELANGLTNHEHRRQTHTDEGCLLLSKETSPFGLEKIQRLSTRWPNSRCHLCVFYFSLSRCTEPARFSSRLIQSERAYRRVWLSISAIYGVKWDRGCSPAPSLAEPLSQPPDSSRLAFSPRSPGPPLLFPPTFLSALPGAPLRILLRSRPLSPKAGPNPLHRSP